MFHLPTSPQATIHAHRGVLLELLGIDIKARKNTRNLQLKKSSYQNMSLRHGVLQKSELDFVTSNITDMCIFQPLAHGLHPPFVKQDVFSHASLFQRRGQGEGGPAF